MCRHCAMFNSRNPSVASHFWFKKNLVNFFVFLEVVFCVIPSFIVCILEKIIVIQFSLEYKILYINGRNPISHNEIYYYKNMKQQSLI